MTTKAMFTLENKIQNILTIYNNIQYTGTFNNNKNLKLPTG